MHVNYIQPWLNGIIGEAPEEEKRTQLRSIDYNDDIAKICGGKTCLIGMLDYSNDKNRI